MGEWFLLSGARRVLLLGGAIVFALATNLTRTLLLSLHADRHGVGSVESVHDLIGTIMISTLIGVIWLSAKLLSRKRPRIGLGDIILAARRFGVTAATRYRRPLVAIAWAVVAGLVSARAVSAHLESRDHTQFTPFFSVRNGGSDTLQHVQVPREIWNELRPSSGEYVRLARRDLPGGAADTYHFFWKPSPWNRFALVHRPDVCMPGIGWETVGQPTPVQVDFGEHGVRCYAFRFRRGNAHALELWGVWRNGDAVPIDYTPEQALGASVAPSHLKLEGKRRSATEIVACSVIGENEPPALHIAVAVMQSVFQYSPQ
jgi:exosortase/archaeosortase family protein